MIKKFVAIIIFLNLLLSSNAQANVCSMPGIDGDQSIVGTVNRSYVATGNVSIGATTLVVGASSGAGPTLGPDDLVLVIQMQDSDISTSNTAAYGGSGGGRGYSNLNSTGAYEFARVDSVVGSTVTLTSGLVNSYRSAPATATAGQRTYQVIRVPQYNNVTFIGGLTAPAWDGEKGGVFVIDVAGSISGNGQTIDLEARGFRGGAYAATGRSTNATQRQEYLATATNNNTLTTRRHATKAEGTAGTPQFVYNGTTVVDTNGLSAIDGYPGGDYARGGPGNAGGGGNDWSNGNDSGGGGGGNFGNGGNGGAGWDRDPVTENVGGLGGGSFPATLSRVVMGGGGGAGVANNTNAPHGGVGGGIVIIRTNTINSSFTVNANGGDGVSSNSNDGGGGAGAGGSIVVTASSGLNLVTLNATGGQGGDAWPITSGANGAHGPGGGGGGGYIIYSSNAGVPTTNIAQGNSGTTTTSNATHGSTNGTGGSDTFETIKYPCAADISVSKDDGTINYTPGASSTYSITVTNAGPADLTGVTVTDTIPDGLTIGSVSCSVAAQCTNINVTGQDLTVTMNVDDGQSIVLNVPVTYSDAPSDY